MNDPRLISELPDIVTRLETLAADLSKLAKGKWGDPTATLFSSPAREVKGALAKLKSDVFTRAWHCLKAQSGLKNADDDDRVKLKMEKEFKLADGLCYVTIETYFEGLKGQADELALEAILKEARGALLYRFFNPSYGEEKGKPEDLVRNDVVKFQLYRDSYTPDTLSSHSGPELAALDKLGQIVVFGVKPSLARAEGLT